MKQHNIIKLKSALRGKEDEITKHHSERQTLFSQLEKTHQERSTLEGNLNKLREQASSLETDLQVKSESIYIYIVYISGERQKVEETLAKISSEKTFGS